MKFNFTRLIILTILLLVSSLVYSQNTDSTHQKKNLIDKTLDLFEFKYKRFSISTFPLMSYDPASELNIGFMTLITIEPKDTSKFNRPTTIVNHFSYSTKEWLNLKSDIALFTAKGLMINAYAQYIDAPDKYFGIANDTLNTSPIKFSIKDIEIKGDIAKSISKNIYTGIIFDFSHTYTESNEVNSIGLSLPSQKNLLLIGIGPHIAFDRRNDISYPSKGEYITASFLYYPKHNDNAYSFYSGMLDVKKYMSIYKDLILASELFTGFSKGDIPFYNYFQLGGKSRLRGISNKYMYIDSHIYYAQIELRKHIWKRFGVVAFTGIGNTGNSYSDLFNSYTKYVYGCGIRFQTSKTDKLNLRLDYGMSRYGDSGVYLTMREAF